MIETVLIPTGILAVGVALVVSAILRAKKTLSPENKPSTWAYLNELGGYFVVGLVVLTVAIYMFFSSFF